MATGSASYAGPPNRQQMKKVAGFVPVIPATVQPTGLTLSLPNGLEIRGIEANNLGLVRDLLGMLA